MFCKFDPNRIPGGRKIILYKLKYEVWERDVIFQWKWIIISMLLINQKGLLPNWIKKKHSSNLKSVDNGLKSL